MGPRLACSICSRSQPSKGGSSKRGIPAFAITGITVKPSRTQPQGSVVRSEGSVMLLCEVHLVQQLAPWTMTMTT
eukprot:4812849-Amphidinium_carterae.1